MLCTGTAIITFHAYVRTTAFNIFYVYCLSYHLLQLPRLFPSIEISFSWHLMGL